MPYRVTYTVNYVVHRMNYSVRATRYYKYEANAERWADHWHKKIIKQVERNTGYSPSDWWFDATVGVEKIEVLEKGKPEFVPKEEGEAS